MKRRFASAGTGIAILLVLACGGCLKRTESAVTLSADGSGVATLTTVFDRDALFDLKNRALGAEAGKGRTADLKTLEGMRRESAARGKGIELISLSYREDAAQSEVVETTEVRFSDWSALHRWFDPFAVEFLESASLRAEADGTWVYDRAGSVGGLAPMSVLISGFTGGPPKPGRVVSMTLSVRFPGKILESDEKARVDGDRVTWRFEGETGGRGTPYQIRVRFAGRPGLRPFRLTTEDILRAREEVGEETPPGSDEDPGSGPLDGAGWREEEEPTPGVGSVTPPYDPPKGSVPTDGRVVHRGRAIAGALVRFALRREDGSYSGSVVARTAEDGTYRIPGLWPATYGVEIQVGRAGAWMPDVQIPKGERFRHDIVLGPHEVVVRVVDPSGTPVEGAEIWMHRGHHQAIPFGLMPTTGSDGTARVSFVESGPATFSATLDQAECEAVTIDVPGTGVSGPVTIRAGGFGTVIVQVRDADGQASPAYLCYRHPTEPVPDVSRFTDPSGRIVFRLSPGRWLVGLSSTRFARNERERFRQFAKEVQVQEGTTQTIVLVKPRR